MASAGSAALASPAAAACETTPPAWEAILTAYMETSELVQTLLVHLWFETRQKLLHMSKSSTSM
jgi:hypothetical protein